LDPRERLDLMDSPVLLVSRDSLVMKVLLDPPENPAKLELTD